MSEAVKFAKANTREEWKEYPLSKEYKEFLIKLEKHLEQKTGEKIIKRIWDGCGLSISHNFSCPNTSLIKELKEEFGIDG